MTDPLSAAALAAAALAALLIVAHAGLAGWRGWLDLRRLEIEARGRPEPASPAGARIELADLRERVRKLEAIAAGVEL